MRRGILLTHEVEVFPATSLNPSAAMRIPRRVPWASKAELAELYDMLFAPGANNASHQAALSRVRRAGDEYES